MQIIRRKLAPMLAQFDHCGLVGTDARMHLGLGGHAPTLAEIAGRTGGDDIFPGGAPALAARDDVIEGQVLGIAAILAFELVAQENIEAGEGGAARRPDIGDRKSTRLNSSHTVISYA